MTVDVSEDKKVDILVLGAGPTGLGACVRLTQLGHCDFLMIEKSEKAGGLACTEITDEGFLFDMGGHVIFSHFKYFDSVLERAYGEKENWNTLQRVSYIRLKNKWIEYPFQNNLSKLDVDDQITCVNGLLDIHNKSSKKYANFDEYIMNTMGEGIADLFMRPYNFKVWAYPTHEMQCEWLGERVATVDTKKVIENILLKKTCANWGPNAVFKFPKSGGTGAIWQAVSKKLISENVQIYGKIVVEINAFEKCVKLNDDSRVFYNKMISTIPLDETLKALGYGDAAGDLVYSSTHVVGLGLRGVSWHDLKCWLYFPEENCPFYRCTIFSLYSKNNVPSVEASLPTLYVGESRVENGPPKLGPYWSLMFEVSESPKKPVDSERIVEDCIRGAILNDLIKKDSEIVSIFHKRLEKGYPTPHLKRDEVLKSYLDKLKNDHQIWSRGRFGSWKYEVANQDHSLMLGVEAVDNILFGSEEVVLNYPDLVNSKFNTERKFEEIDKK